MFGYIKSVYTLQRLIYSQVYTPCDDYRKEQKEEMSYMRMLYDGLERPDGSRCSNRMVLQPRGLRWLRKRIDVVQNAMAFWYRCTVEMVPMESDGLKSINYTVRYVNDSLEG
jgi:hypothetical protein